VAFSIARPGSMVGYVGVPRGVELPLQEIEAHQVTPGDVDVRPVGETAEFAKNRSAGVHEGGLNCGRVCRRSAREGRMAWE
jgi:hypothetical protein